MRSVDEQLICYLTSRHAGAYRVEDCVHFPDPNCASTVAHRTEPHWVCQYCGGDNTEDSPQCKYCGAPQR